MSDVTRIIEAIQEGDVRAADQLLPIVYDELRRVAANKMAREATPQTLQPTALVHEAWLRLNGGDDNQKWDGRAHFFAAAAEAMRRILIDRARSKRAVRHGGAQEAVDLSQVCDQPGAPTQVHYVKLAGVISLLAFIVNYRPELFDFIVQRANAVLTARPTESR